MLFRGEGSIPSKQAALMILEGLLHDSTDLNNDDTHCPDADSLQRLDLRMELTRHLERGRRPTPPEAAELTKDAAGAQGADGEGPKADRNVEFHRELRRRLWERKRQGQGPAGAEPGGDDGKRVGEVGASPMQSRNLPAQEVGDPLAAEAIRRLRTAKRNAAEGDNT